MKRVFATLLALALVLAFSLVTATPVMAQTGPPATSGLVLHLDTSDADSITKNGDNKVSQWADLSGNNNHAIQGASGNQPLWVENVLAGKPVIRFDGLDDYLQTAPFGSELPQPNTIIVVWKLATDDFSRTVIDGIAADRRHAIIKVLDSPPTWNREIILHAGYPNLFGSPLPAPSDFLITSALFHGTNSKLWIDGLLDTEGETGTQALTGVTIGGRYDGAVNNLDGDIAEILIYGRALSDAERQEVEQYLGVKWLGTCLGTATDTGTACFISSHGVIEDLTAVSVPPGAPVVFPHGMFSFTVTGITGQVTITVQLPGPVPVGTKWWKYYNNSWYPLNIGDDDGDNIITVTLHDGVPPEDSDGVTGQITDDGGPGGSPVGWDTYPVSKVRVLLPWIALLAAIIAGASFLVIRRRRAQT